jgi:FAD/FMN-containing dehydrogenase
LTGIVTWVELQLIPIRSNLIDATYFRFPALSDFFSLYRELDAHHEYTVAWIDCLAKGRRTGRGIFMAGDHAPHGKLEVPSRLEKRVPITPPISFVNHASLRLFNLVYYYGHRVKTTKKSVAYDRFFYPLDDLLDWNRLYGRRGLQQFQCVVPDSSAEAAIGDLLANIAATGTGSFLAVLKRCGDIASPGLLSFPMPGVSLALDFPHSDKLARDLLPRLDAIVRAAGGRLYPAKDAHMSANDFRTSYPAYEQVEKLRDPAINSRFWKRVAQT